MTDDQTSVYPELLEFEPTDPKGLPPDRGNMHAVKLERAQREAVEFEEWAAKKPAPDPRTQMPSHLKESERATARDQSCAAAVLMLRHPAECHYTEGSSRWMGIAQKLRAKNGHYPTESDCSASLTWWLWNSLAAHYHLKDIVNGEAWKAGYTGTLIKHGVEIPHEKNWIRCDVFLYGDPFGSTGHTALGVGRDPRTKSHMVISHGSEAGPFYLPYDYRSDLRAVHRFI